MIKVPRGSSDTTHDRPPPAGGNGAVAAGQVARYYRTLCQNGGGGGGALRPPSLPLRVASVRVPCVVGLGPISTPTPPCLVALHAGEHICGLWPLHAERCRWRGGVPACPWARVEFWGAWGSCRGAGCKPAGLLPTLQASPHRPNACETPATVPLSSIANLEYSHPPPADQGCRALEGRAGGRAGAKRRLPQPGGPPRM
jgi:hypothetical protein